MSGIRLRPTREADLDFALAAERHPDNSPFVGQWTREQHLSASRDAHAAHLIVEDLGRNQAGFVIILGLQSQDRTLLIKRLVITDKGRGYGRATLAEVARLAFEEWEAHRLWLDVVDNNDRARHLYREAGFVEEGMLRECLYYAEEGCFRSSVVMGMLEQEYRNR